MYVCANLLNNKTTVLIELKFSAPPPHILFDPRSSTGILAVHNIIIEKNNIYSNK